MGTEDLSLQSAYPFTAFKIILNATGTTVLSGKCAMLLYSCGPLYWQHLDLEVLYVGQAFGADGSRTAADRLGNHETLQAIYAETMRLSPDQDIWLFLTEFTEFMMVMIDGKDKNVVVSEDEDSAHIHQVVHSEISEQQAINFGEAALIRFFAPRYNKRFKDTFPNPAHKTYAECYDLDLNMVSVELDTEDAGFGFGVTKWNRNGLIIAPSPCTIEKSGGICLSLRMNASCDKHWNPPSLDGDRNLLTLDWPVPRDRHGGAAQVGRWRPVQAARPPVQLPAPQCARGRLGDLLGRGRARFELEDGARL
jgi:hypothetical protein